MFNTLFHMLYTQVCADVKLFLYFLHVYNNQTVFAAGMMSGLSVNLDFHYHN
jgi:hypothetical protein